MRNMEDTLEDLWYWRYAKKQKNNAVTHNDPDDITIKHIIFVDEQRK